MRQQQNRNPKKMRCTFEDRKVLQFRLSSAVGCFVLLAATSADCCHLLLKKKKLHACLLHPHVEVQLFLSPHLHLLVVQLARSPPVSRAGKGFSSRRITPPYITPIHTSVLLAYKPPQRQLVHKVVSYLMVLTCDIYWILTTKKKGMKIYLL